MFRALIVDDARAELEVLLFLIQKNNGVHRFDSYISKADMSR